MEDFRTLSASPCVVHLTHFPRIDRYDGRYTIHKHHIWPKEFNGPDEPWNIIAVCPTGHDAIHELLRAWLKVDGEPAWEIRQNYHPKERMYAEKGYNYIKAAPLP